MGQQDEVGGWTVWGEGEEGNRGVRQGDREREKEMETKGLSLFSRDHHISILSFPHHFNAAMVLTLLRVLAFSVGLSLLSKPFISHSFPVFCVTIKKRIQNASFKESLSVSPLYWSTLIRPSYLNTKATCGFNFAKARCT